MGELNMGCLNKNAWKIFTFYAILFIFIIIIIKGLITSRASSVLTVTPSPVPDFISPTIPPTSIVTYKINYPRRMAGAGVIIWNFPLNASPLEFWQTNAWYEKKQDKYIYVFAGSERDGGVSADLTHGAVHVMVTNQFPNNLPGGGTYEAPINNGPITIVDANGEILTLVSDDGSILYFDVASRQFTVPDSPDSSKVFSRQSNNGTIIEKGTSPFSGQSYTFYNQWYKEIKSERITVYAGLDNNNHNGILLVVTSNGAPQIGNTTNIYSVPNQFIYFRIFDVNGDLITFVNNELRQFVFDVSARRFLSDSEIDNLPVDPAVATYEAPVIDLLVTPSPTITKMATPNRTQTAIALTPNPYP
jgi:hypothetical protein